MLTFEIFLLDDNYLDWMITTQLDDNYQEVVIIQWYCSYHPVLSFDVWLHWNRIIYCNIMISSLDLFRVGMITDLEPCSRFNAALFSVHMVAGLGSPCSTFNLAPLRVHMLTNLGLYS